MSSMSTNKVLLAAVAGVGAAVPLVYICSRKPRVEIDEDDEEAVIPTQQDLRALKQRGKSEETIAREEAYASLPERKVIKVAPLPGSIVRERREYAPRVLPLKKRIPSDFPSSDMKKNPAELWEDPSPQEYKKDEKDAWRWAWGVFTTVDENTQLVSVEHQYVSEAYGVRFIVVPTLRLADTQFYNSVMDTAISERGVVLVEALHSVRDDDRLKELEKHAFGKAPYEAMPREQSRMMAQRRGMEGAHQVISVVGGQCTTLDYLQALIELHCHWLLADPGLDADSMNNIGVSVNHKKSFNPLCVIREAYLAKYIDRCLRAARTDEAWEKLTGQKREGEKVVILPWNGRHCARLEKFLVEHRGFTPLDKTTDRVMFDPEQTRKMVEKALVEDSKDESHESLKDIAFPVELPEYSPPPHNFGPLAEQMQAEDAMRGLQAVAEADEERDDVLETVIEVGREMPEEPTAAASAEAEAEASTEA